MANINLLPREIRESQRGRRLVLIALAALGGVALILIVFSLLQRGAINREQEELDDLQARAGRLRTEVAALAEFGQIQEDVNRRRSTLATALTGDVAWSKLLNDVSLVIPDNSWLTNLALSGAAGMSPLGTPSIGTTTFSGFVFDFPGLADWLLRVAQIDGLTFVYLTSGTEQDLSGREVVTFGANASITDVLLSRRCEEGRPCP